MISSSPDLANEDFKGLRQAVEYRLSLNMGKELAMVENNEIGRLVPEEKEKTKTKGRRRSSGLLVIKK